MFPVSCVSVCRYVVGNVPLPTSGRLMSLVFAGRAWKEIEAEITRPLRLPQLLRNTVRAVIGQNVSFVGGQLRLTQLSHHLDNSDAKETSNMCERTTIARLEDIDEPLLLRTRRLPDAETCDL